MTTHDPAQAQGAPAPESIRRSLEHLVFFGTTPAPAPAPAPALAPVPLPGEADAATGTEYWSEAEVRRVEGELHTHGRELDSLLVLDAVYDPQRCDAARIEAALARELPRTARPCLTMIPVLPGSLGERSLALQGVSAGEAVVPGGPRDTSADPGASAGSGSAPRSGSAVGGGTGERFPESAAAGCVVAVAGQSTDTDDGMVAQTDEVMDRVAGLLAGHGATWDDAVRFDVFYRAEGTKEGWAVNARERARRFTEPGPATTGIPVGFLPGRAKILLRTLAVRGARGLGLRTESWPEGHWDWPFHLPYKHGIGAAGTVFVGGQVSLGPRAEVLDPDRLDIQTATSVRNIRKVAGELGRGPESVLRLIAFYQHTDDTDPRTVERVIAEELPGHTYQLSLVGLPYLAYAHMVVEIEAELR